MKKIKAFYPNWGPFILETQIEDRFVDLLLEKGNESKIQKLDARKRLAGVLDKEFFYDNYESWFVPEFNPYVNAYLDGLTSYKNDAFGKGLPKSWTIDNLWINYQQAGDYNPPHIHDSDLSFIIYLQIPKKLIKEYKTRKGIHNNEGPGVVCFVYGEQLPFSIVRFWKFPEEGMIILFPAWVKHYVHSFKSKVERISVSGNIRFDWS